MNYDVLRSELMNDPLGRGYAGMTDQQAADSLNVKDRPRKRTIVPAHEVIEATVSAEYDALTSANKTRYQTITGAGEVNAQGANTRAAFGAMFGPATTTRANLLALENDTPWSRAEELGLPPVGAHHVAYARAL